LKSSPSLGRPFGLALACNMATVVLHTNPPGVHLNPSLTFPARTSQLHHKKHHQAYVNGLNKALEQYQEADQKGDLKTMIALQPAIKFNGGGAHD
jgi:superoxide dismutase